MDTSTMILVAVAVLVHASLWKIFTKAGQPGWLSLIPIYNYIVLVRITGHSAWWFILLLIPYVNAIASILLMLRLAGKFGKGPGFGVGLVLLSPLFLPLLAFGDARYQGEAAAAPAPGEGEASVALNGN